MKKGLMPSFWIFLETVRMKKFNKSWNQWKKPRNNLEFWDFMRRSATFSFSSLYIKTSQELGTRGLGANKVPHLFFQFSNIPVDKPHHRTFQETGNPHTKEFL
jgi:hypothetical protein